MINGNEIMPSLYNYEKVESGHKGHGMILVTVLTSPYLTCYPKNKAKINIKSFVFIAIILY